ncbi:MAG: DciA family protein [Candidatus Fonsibacter sp.]
MVLDKSSNKAFAQGLRPLQSLLSENVKKILKKDGFIYFEIIKNWKNIVGEKMFKDVSPVKIKKINNENILSINVNKNVMIEIEYSRDQIIEKINGYLGFNAIHKIQINSTDASFKIKKRFILSDNILKKINEIKNKNLKEIFLKLNK